MIKSLWSFIKEHPNRAMFLVPILLVAGISISHVVSWYNLANPISWAIYLSIAIEIGAMTALVAATNKIKGGVWFMFGLITFIQMIGNIFFCYKEIDETGELFKSWMELTGPVWEMLGSKANDVIAMKRWLAFLEGGLLPVISLTSLHFFTKYDDGKTGNEKVTEVIKEVIVEKEVIKEVIVEVPVIEEVIVEKIVEKIIEVPVYQSQSIDEEDDYFDDESELIDIQDNMITQSETIEEEPIVDDTPKPNRLSYVKP
jgi:hypothetical protein